MKTKYDVKGMHCASCVARIEKTIGKLPGVGSVHVNLLKEKATIEHEHVALDVMNDAIKKYSYELIAEPDEMSDHPGMSQGMHQEGGHDHMMIDTSSAKRKELESRKFTLILAFPVLLFSIAMMVIDVVGARHVLGPVGYEFSRHLMPILATIILFGPLGRPYLSGLAMFLRTGAANMDSLVGLGATVAFLYSFILQAFEDSLKGIVDTDAGYYDTTITLIVLVAIGKWLEDRSKLSTGDAIAKLIGLGAKTALVKHENGREMEMPIQSVKVGDVLVVKPGAKVPVDGEVIDGASYVDEGMVTGEPMPVKKLPGSKVVGGTLNTTGSFDMRATKIGGDTFLAHVIKMVEEAQSSRAPIQALADRIVEKFMPAVIVVAILSFICWILWGYHIGDVGKMIPNAVEAFVGVLVIACPCAMGLATPLAVVVGVGQGAKEGILVKDAAALEKLSEVDTLVLDKTGTITAGEPSLVKLHVYDMTEERALRILASLESKSEHPIAQAVMKEAGARGINQGIVTDFVAHQGKGVEGKVDAIHYNIGGAAMLAMLGLAQPDGELEQELASGATPLYLVRDDKILAAALVSDKIKAGTADAIKDLKARGLDIVMATGDDVRAATFVAGKTGIKTFYASLLPEDKFSLIKRLKEEGKKVAMTGDGINDTPALAEAHVGIAMGTGTDVAIEASDMTVLHGDVSKLVKAFKVAELTMKGIHQNLFWAFIYNIIGIPLAAGLAYIVTGYMLSPAFAGAAMGLSSVFVVMNSLRLQKMKI